MRKLFQVILMLLWANLTSASQLLTLQQALVLAYKNNPDPNPTVLLQGEDIGGSGSFQGFESAETTL